MALRNWVSNKLGIDLNNHDFLITQIVKKVIRKSGVANYSKTYYTLRTIYTLVGGRRRIFHSQSIFGEDYILKMYLPESYGSYVDVGAGLPFKGSNTAFLYKQGWSGITIDPLESNISKHKYKRPRDTQLLAAVLSELSTEPLEFYEYYAHEFSTNSLERVQVLKEKGILPRKSYIVEVLELSTILPVVDPLEPFLLDLDIEGNEFGILEGLNWASFRPRVICVEEWRSPIYEKSPVRLLLESQGYLLVSRAFITSIYVHRNYLEQQKDKSDEWSEWYSN